MFNFYYILCLQCIAKRSQYINHDLKYLIIMNLTNNTDSPTPFRKAKNYYYNQGNKTFN